MAIHLKLFAAFAEFLGKREIDVPYRPGITCNQLWNEIKSTYPRIAQIPVLFAIHQEYVPADTQLQDGDILMAFPPLSGGDTRYIFDTPLSVQAALEAIQDDTAGGEAYFIGRVRRHNEGKVVKYLFYECEASMAEREIDRIIHEMYDKWPLCKVHVQHRIGRLEVGQVAVIVAVSAEHRREALEACRYGIDELKHRVPIWKKEVSDSGEEWIGTCEEKNHEDTNTRRLTKNK